MMVKPTKPLTTIPLSFHFHNTASFSLPFLSKLSLHLDTPVSCGAPQPTALVHFCRYATIDYPLYFCQNATTDYPCLVLLLRHNSPDKHGQEGDPARALKPWR